MGASFSAYLSSAADIVGAFCFCRGSAASPAYFPCPHAQPLAAPAAPTRLFPHVGSQSNTHSGANSTSVHAPAQHTQNNCVHAEARAIHSRSSSCSASLESPTNTVHPRSNAIKSSGGPSVTYIDQLVTGMILL